MIGALERLKSDAGGAAARQSLKAFGIADGRGFARLFATHPPLDERIAALQAGGA